MSEPRPDTEIRADLDELMYGHIGDRPVAAARLAADVAPLLDALSAALAAKEAAEDENQRLRRQLDEAARYGLDSGL
jgi:hypothetical protein